MEYIPFPKTMYHPGGAHKIVNSQKEMDALSEEWQTKPHPGTYGVPEKSKAVKDPEAPKAKGERKSKRSPKADDTPPTV